MATPFDMYDPWELDMFLSYFRHPILPTGYNSTDYNGDDVNGRGVNEEVWPEYFETFEARKPLVMTDWMLGVFETECPDLVVPYENTEIIIPAEIEEQQVRKAG
jgi:hypothetical protein